MSRLREAIRRQLGEARAPVAERRAARLASADARSVTRVERRRRKLLDLYYSDRISADLFAQENQRLRAELELCKVESDVLAEENARLDDVARRFEDEAAVLAELDVEHLWGQATVAERKVLVEELLSEVALFPDHLEVEVVGVPRLNVLLEEVGLARGPLEGSPVQTAGVRGGT